MSIIGIEYIKHTNTNMQQLLFFIGKLCSYICPKTVFDKWNTIKLHCFVGYKSGQFRHLGEKSTLRPHTIYVGEKYISIGSNSHIGDYGRLTAYSYYPHTKQIFSPEIIIGDNCSIGSQSHVTAINKIVIGNNVLTGPRVLITDNAHGSSVDENEKLDIPPYKRELISNGPVIIEDNVWIGEGSMIMPNVTIGKGSIIAANSVVTKDVPPYCMAAGSPAKIIKTLR